MNKNLPHDELRISDHYGPSKDPALEGHLKRRLAMFKHSDLSGFKVESCPVWTVHKFSMDNMKNIMFIGVFGTALLVSLFFCAECALIHGIAATDHTGKSDKVAKMIAKSKAAQAKKYYTTKHNRGKYLEVDPSVKKGAPGAPGAPGAIKPTKIFRLKAKAGATELL